MRPAPEPVGRPADPAAAVRIVPMQPADVGAVAAIDAVAQPRPWSEGLFRSELALGAPRCYLVARAGDRVVGYAGLMLAGAEAHLTNVAVEPGHRRRGVATLLVAGLARAAAARGARDLTLEVRTSNRAAQSLYRRFGFAVEGVRPGYYADNGEDAAVMWVRDIDDPGYRSLLDRLERRAARHDGGPR